MIDKQRLVAVAADVLAEQGLEGMQLVVVARAAGVSVGSLYNHFPSKGHLLAAVGDRVEQGFVEAMQAAAPPGVSLRGAVPALTAALVREATTSPAARVLAELPAVPRAGGGGGGGTLVRAWIVERVLAAQAAGEVGTGDVEAIAEMGFALVKAGMTVLDRRGASSPVQTLMTAGLLALIPAAEKNEATPGSM